MTLQDQYLAFLYAEKLAKAGILFKDVHAWYCLRLVYKKPHLALEIQDINDLESDLEIYKYLKDPESLIIFAPTLQVIIRELDLELESDLEIYKYLKDPESLIIFAPTLKDLLSRLPENIDYIWYDNKTYKLAIKIKIKGGTYSVTYAHNSCTIGEEAETPSPYITRFDDDPKIAACEMLLLLKEKGLLPELTNE